MPSVHLQRSIRQAIEQAPSRSRIRRVSLFGSHAKGEANASSDIDLLVEFREPVGYFELVHVQRDLEQALGSAVDLVTPNALSPYLREDILRHAIPVYES